VKTRQICERRQTELAANSLASGAGRSSGSKNISAQLITSQTASRNYISMSLSWVESVVSVWVVVLYPAVGSVRAYLTITSLYVRHPWSIRAVKVAQLSRQWIRTHSLLPFDAIVHSATEKILSSGKSLFSVWREPLCLEEVENAQILFSTVHVQGDPKMALSESGENL